MIRRSLLLVVSVACLAAAPPALADPVTVTLDSGQTLTGAPTAGLNVGAQFAEGRMNSAASTFTGWPTAEGFTVTTVADMYAKAGKVQIEDTLTLSQAATVQLIVNAAGPLKTQDIGIGTGCGGAGARTAPGFHRSGLDAAGFTVVAIPLPAGASPVRALLEASAEARLQFAIAVPAGVTATSTSTFLPIAGGPFNDRPNTSVGARAKVRDGCSALEAVQNWETAASGGVTSLLSSASGPQPPAGYIANRYLQFATSATTTKAIFMSFERSRLGASSLAKVFQRQGSAWQDVTYTAAFPYTGVPGPDLALHAAVTSLAGQILIASPVRPTVPGVYADFGSTHGLRLNGSALPVAGKLRLLNAGDQAGSVFTTTPLIEPSRSFKSRFAFQITNGAADGLAFVVHRDPDGPAALGTNGGKLAYDTISPSVAVEFDTFRNVPDGNDPNANHVGISLDGAWHASILTATPPFLLASPGTTYAWVDYDRVQKALSVFVSRSATKPDTPMMKLPIDLAAWMGGPIYAGFTAGSGSAFATQEILSWHLEREPAPVDTGPPPGGGQNQNPSPPGGGDTPGPPAPKVKLRATLSFGYSQLTRKSTRLARLVLREIPARSTVKITCKGGGCAKALKGKGVTKRNVTGTLNLKAYIKQKLSAGAVIKITVSRAGAISVTKTLTIRKGKPPVVKSK